MTSRALELLLLSPNLSPPPQNQQALSYRHAMHDHDTSESFDLIEIPFVCHASAAPFAKQNSFPVSECLRPARIKDHNHWSFVQKYALLRWITFFPHLNAPRRGGRALHVTTKGVRVLRRALAFLQRWQVARYSHWKGKRAGRRGSRGEETRETRDEIQSREPCS